MVSEISWDILETLHYLSRPQGCLVEEPVGPAFTHTIHPNRIETGVARASDIKGVPGDTTVAANTRDNRLVNNSALQRDQFVPAHKPYIFRIIDIFCARLEEARIDLRAGLVFPHAVSEKASVGVGSQGRPIEGCRDHLRRRTSQPSNLTTHKKVHACLVPTSRKISEWALINQIKEAPLLNMTILTSGCLSSFCSVLYTSGNLYQPLMLYQGVVYTRRTYTGSVLYASQMEVISASERFIL